VLKYTNVFGHLLYRSKRIGQFSRPFFVYKFRTMIENADKIGGSSTADDDPRITKIGRILRKTKLDELPQIINILRGEMGLIGWRPEVPEYLHTIPKEVLKTKPGVIGLATLDDIDEGAELKGKENPDRYYEEVILPRKRKLELYYALNKNWRLNLWIIWQTIYRLLKR